MKTLPSIAYLKAEAKRLGFYACGVAKSAPVEVQTADAFSRWIEHGNHGSMTYMAGNIQKRLNPNLLLPSARSVIVVAMNYYPERRLDESQLQFAFYAYGQDYHEVMRSRLTQLAETLHINDVRYSSDIGDTECYEGLICCDTVPVLERYWAWKAGIGWIGKNNSLVIPHAGSFFFLGVIITELAFSEYNTPILSYCGTCENCLHACPTGALTEPYRLDASKCLSYLTIENRGNIPSEFAAKMGNSIYGCDRCQLACPHNRFAQPSEIEEFAPSEEFLSMTADNWHDLTEERYRQLFKGSAVKRAKYSGLKRNIDALSQETEE